MSMKKQRKPFTSNIVLQISNWLLQNSPAMDGNYAHGCKNPARHKFATWKGWTIGAYVHARLPAYSYDGRHEPSWEDNPVLLVDVWKESIGAAQFVVAHLYTHNTATQHVRALGDWKGAFSLLAWPYQSEYVLSNHFETVHEWQLRVWTRSAPPSVASCSIFDICNNRLARSIDLSETDIGRALSISFTFPRFLQLPREIRDYVYEIALLDERQL